MYQIDQRSGRVLRHRSNVKFNYTTSLAGGIIECSDRHRLSLHISIPLPPRPLHSSTCTQWTYFISALPNKVGELGSIIVVVDRFSKYATFIAAPIVRQKRLRYYLFLSIRSRGILIYQVASCFRKAGLLNTALYLKCCVPTKVLQWLV